MSQIHEYFRWIMKVLVWIGAFSLLAVMLIFMVNIISRAFGKPILGTYELISVFMVPAVSYAIGYTALTGNHIVVEVIINRLQKRSRKILALITTLLSICIWALIAWESTEFALKKWAIGETTVQLTLPMPLFRMIWALGVWVLVLVLCVELVGVMKGHGDR